MSGYVSESVRCKNLIDGRVTLVTGCRDAMLWCDHNLTFDLAVLTLNLKMLSVGS